jgi:NAD(P)H-hydrate epimerase
MCLPKRGNCLFPGREFCGDLHVVDIGMPRSLVDPGYPRLTGFAEVRGMLPFRQPGGNKGTFGQVLVIAGARGFSGAAVMAAASALKTGAGLVRLAAPRGIMNIVEARQLEVVKVPLEQTGQETISPAAMRTLMPVLERSDTVVIGPGITTHPETARFVLDFLPLVKAPLIIDADAINIVARHQGIMKKLRAPFILTPHPGELSRLIKKNAYAIDSDRIDLAPQCAGAYGSILVLKGAPTVISAPSGETYVNPTGNSGLATAGSGDVLVGMIGGLLAQRVPALQASVAGVFLHGLCADMAMEKTNEYSLTASDLFRYIPRSIDHVIRRDYEKNMCEE